MMTIFRLPLTCAVLVAVLFGCGGGGGSSGGTIPIPPPNPGVNQPPAITSLSPQGTSTDPVRIRIGAKQRIIAAASDPDKDTLTYTWTANNGQVAGRSAEADFTAPAKPSNAIVTVAVADGHGHTASARCYFAVYNPDTPEPPPPTRNEPPLITSISAKPDSVGISGKSTVTAAASDPDGDELTYTWTTNGGGIESQSGTSAVWIAPNTPGSCSVTVSVSDGSNAAVSASVAIAVAGVTQPPITSGLSATYVQNSGKLAHPDLTKGTVVFTRVDPAINFDWGRKAPDPRLVTNPATGNGHDFGVIWTGYIKCESPGTYSFRARYDDGFRLWISDDQNKMQQVMDGWFTGPVTTEGRITLQGGKWYKLQAQYFEDEDRSYVQLYWLVPQTSTWTVVPTDVLRTQ